MPGIEDLQNKMSEKSLIDFLNSDPNQVDFGFVRNLVKEIILNPERTISNQERQMLSQALERNPNLLSDQELSIINDQMMKGSGRTMSNIDSGRTISNIDRQGRTISDIDRGGRTMSNIDRQGRTISDIDRQIDILGRTASSEDKIKILNQMKETFGKDLLMNIALGNVVGKDFSNLDREIASKLYIGVSPEDILRPKYGDMIEGRTISDIDRGGRTMSNMDRQMIKGYAEGDEVSMMMMELEGDEDGMQEEAMKELEAARPEFEMMQQLAQVVINLIEQGASEAEIVAILKEQGLDDEDIQTLLEFVNEMMGQAEQGGMAEDDIGSQLQGMM